MKNFFISYTAADADWADWIAFELDAIGASALMQKWDFAPGSNFAEAMHSAIRECERLVLVLSEASLKSRFVTAEWTAFFAKDPDGTDKLLVPIRIDDCRPDGLLGQIVYADLFGQTEDQARATLLQALGLGGSKRRTRPLFPGTSASAANLSGPTFPGTTDSDLVGASVGILQSYFSARAGYVFPTIRRRALGRVFVERHLHNLVETEQAGGRNVSVVSLDVDGMSGINTNHGVDIGDAVMERLFHFCEELKERLVAGRMGDDTLFVVLSTAEQHNVAKIASALVKKVARANWSAMAKGLFVHCSSGFAVFDVNVEPAFDAVHRAIEGQLSARRQGGNRAVPGPTFSRLERERREKERLAMRERAISAELRRHAKGNWPIS